MSLATLTSSGRAAIVKAIRERTLHLAWGAGLEEWDAEGAILPGVVDRTALFNEIGRRAVATTSFCTTDLEGDIVVPVANETSGVVSEVRYRLSEEPQPYLYIRINYDFGDAANSIIREIGLFMDTKVKETVPAGQKYFTPGEIEDPGILLAMQLIKPTINRSPSVRQSVEFVLPI